MSSPTVSIIIPTYNSENTIVTAIESILCQTYHKFEILVLDGASTDQTVNIVSGYARRDQRLRYFSENDKGIYDAMNKAIQLASGEWLYFMGSDDSLYNETVLENVFTPENCQNDILYGNVLSNHFGGVYDGEFTIEKLYNKNICHQAIFLKRKIFSVIGDFDISFKAYGDWEHNIRWFLNPQFRKKYVDVIVANYGEGGFSSRNADHQFALKKDEIFLKYGRQAIPRPFRKLLLQSRANAMKTQNKFIGYLKYKLLSYMVYA